LAFGGYVFRFGGKLKVNVVVFLVVNAFLLVVTSHFHPACLLGSLPDCDATAHGNWYGVGARGFGLPDIIQSATICFLSWGAIYSYICLYQPKNK